VSNVTYKGVTTAAGTFQGGSGIIGFDSGIVLSTGQIADVVGPNETDSTTTAHGTPGDAQLSSLAGGTETHDAAVLGFDFVASSDTLSFQYAFGSEAYVEYVNSEYNDVFGFFINGTNCAMVGGLPVSVNTVNDQDNAGSFLDNTAATINTELDGLTTVLTCTASVKKGATNHLKLAIADVSDEQYDSAVFLKAGSFITTTTKTNPKGTKPPASNDRKLQKVSGLTPLNTATQYIGNDDWLFVLGSEQTKLMASALEQPGNGGRSSCDLIGSMLKANTLTGGKIVNVGMTAAQRFNQLCNAYKLMDATHYWQVKAFLNEAAAFGACGMFVLDGRKFPTKTVTIRPVGSFPRYNAWAGLGTATRIETALPGDPEVHAVCGPQGDPWIT